jgi:MFS family permease
MLHLNGFFATLGRTTFRSLRHRNYRLYFFGQIVSFVGSWMQTAALMWLVFDLTTDPFWPPLLLVAVTGPTLILGTLGGWVSDRVPRGKLVFVLQSLLLLSAVVLTVLTLTSWLSPWWMFGLALFNGVVMSFDLPARLAFVPDLIPAEDLINAVSLNALLFNAGRAVGPALAAAVYLLVDDMFGATNSRLGSAACFLVNAVSYAAVLVALWMIRTPKPCTTEAKTKTGSAFAGYAFVWQYKPLLGLLLCTALFSTFGWPLMTLFPTYTKNVYHLAEKHYSLLVSALGVGALLAALTNASFGRSGNRQSWFLVIGSIGTTLGVFGLALAPPFPLALACSSLFGFGMILYLSTGQTVLQMRVPAPLRGRVLALWPMALSGTAMFGHLFLGDLARRIPVTTLLTFMGTGLLVCAGLIAWLAVALKRPPTAVAG